MSTDAPKATYRLQLGPDLGFAAAADLVEYLAALGVTHLYCSPVLQAVEGSTHGYDVTDPSRVSDALGGEEGLRGLADAAAGRGLALLVDFVPNHMGIGPDNALWTDLLAEGQRGRGAAFFDVDWSPATPGTEGKVILPVLEAPYGAVLHAGELAITEDAQVAYHDHRFPLSKASRDAVERSGGTLGGEPGRPETWARLHGLLESQHYRLVHWRAGDALVNYRRFFAIDELAGLRTEDEQVFTHLHATVLRLVREGVIDGLRLDHVDGLTDPAGYLERLRGAVGAQVWLLVEKILAAGEPLPRWPVAGTTGYEFIADCVDLFVHRASEGALTEAAAAAGAWPDAADSLDRWTRAAKREVLEQDLAADAERLVDRIWALTQRDLEARDVSRGQCRLAVLATLAALEVYRLYTRPGENPSPQDRARIDAAISRARDDARAVPDPLWGFLADVLAGRHGEDALAAEALRRFHQVSAAAMAKGVEDTVLYRHHRLVARNDVGVEPERFAGDVAAFHRANAARADRHPHGLLTTATHDTKRGEDVRLRIAALSELPERWTAAVDGWRGAHQRLLTDTPEGPAPDPATAYLAYQTFVGVWPPGDEPDLEALASRVGAYLVKASREAGRRTSWTDPDRGFEQALQGFVDALCDPASGFVAEVADLARSTGEIAMASGLSQVVLRCTSPGAPDTYQGMELWDDHLVDPDNRRRVDFARRRELLATLDAHPPPLDDLVARRADGRLKLWVLSRALRARRDHPGCFGPAGSYVPLEAEGEHAGRVVAFARVGPGDEAAVTVAPRLVGPLVLPALRPPLGDVWGDTAVALPPALAGRAWRCALSGAEHAEGRLGLAGVLRDLPVALLTSPGPPPNGTVPAR